jgi:hypothetical protein
VSSNFHFDVVVPTTRPTAAAETTAAYSFRTTMRTLEEALEHAYVRDDYALACRLHDAKTYLLTGKRFENGEVPF